MVLKSKKVIKVIVFAIIMIVLLGCSYKTEQCKTTNEELESSVPKSQPPGKIYLFGEFHSERSIQDLEFDLWYDFYHNHNMRHLFIEDSYYTAEFLNLWMHSYNDHILDVIYEQSIGTISHFPCVKEFYKKIKEQCPDTIFHGTDIGHQFYSTGEQYLGYLENNDLADTDTYVLTKEAIEQGRCFFLNPNFEFRENTMVKNFKREYDKLNGESIMGIYGISHAKLNGMAYRSKDVFCMGKQLRDCYEDDIISMDLTKKSEPIGKDTLEINGKTYEASYFGRKLVSAKDYSKGRFWRLENASDDFKDCQETGILITYNDYPMYIREGEIFAIELTKADGSVEMICTRYSGNAFANTPTTEELLLK